MPSLTEIVADYARSVQPLVFETGLTQFPYSTAGTVFLVGYEGKAFVLTTRHGLRPESLGPICVFPSDTSNRLIPLDDAFFVPQLDEPEDFMDLVVIAIDNSRIANSEVGEARLIALSPKLNGWPTDAAELVLVGYPEDHSFVDPESEELHTQRVALNARYVGPSSLPYLHEACVTDGHGLSTFSGFSGGPVFAVLRPPGRPPTAGLCGMAIRGTSSSNIFHFLDRSVLIDALKVRIERSATSQETHSK